ncbi:MAG: hypothetical protein DI635_10120 [Pseudoxanthomonas suwonensis]|nr:MAG: hypothetical protein DI635_10120 [Pseudoxanthomonas suwonensis]
MGYGIDSKGIKREIEQEAYRAYEEQSGKTLARAPDGSIRPQGHNDELDAFRHAYVSGRVTQKALDVQTVAKHFGDANEIGPAHPNDPYEHRMDLWNNAVGRRLGDELSATDLGKGVYDALRDGTLIKDLSDPRLQQLYPDDPRLKRPVGDPQRELLNQSDVDRINRDIDRALDKTMSQANAFPANHADQAMFARIRSDLPASVSDEKVAEALKDARTRGGLETAAEINSVALKNGNIYVIGHVPGFRSITGADTPAPAMHDTLASLGQSQEHVRGQAQQAHRGQNEPYAPQSGGPPGQQV